MFPLHCNATPRLTRQHARLFTVKSFLKLLGVVNYYWYTYVSSHYFTALTSYSSAQYN